jgi:hypothetical protein
MKTKPETIDWHTTGKPDDDTTVLVYTPTADDPVWLGYFDSGEAEAGGTGWIDISGATLEKPVTAWAHLPAGPQLKEKAVCKTTATTA